MFVCVRVLDTVFTLHLHVPSPVQSADLLNTFVLIGRFGNKLKPKSCVPHYVCEPELTK